MEQLINSEEYYQKAKIWYFDKYIKPFIIRSKLYILSIVICIFFAIVLINVYMLFPLNKQVPYAIKVDGSYDYTAKVTKADAYNDVASSIAKIFLETYVEIRESYSYQEIQSKLLYIQNTSTKPIYNKFRDYLSIDNPESPTITLQKDANRSITIESITFIANDLAKVRFNSIANKNTGKKIEDKNWEATISFMMDTIKTSTTSEDKFNFTVTEYKLKLVRDNNVS